MLAAVSAPQADLDGCRYTSAMRPPLRWRILESALGAWAAKSGQDGAFYVCQVHVKKNGTVRWTITGGGGTALDGGIASNLDAAKAAVEQCLDGLYALNA